MPRHFSSIWYMDESTLIQKLRKIEALHAGATTPGERDAAERARQRILARLARRERTVPRLVEYRFPMKDLWSRKVFVALLRSYGITHYRYKRQRRTTVMARVDRRFVEVTLWPEFHQLSRTLRARLSEVTEQLVAEVLHKDISEPDD